MIIQNHPYKTQYNIDYSVTVRNINLIVQYLRFNLIYIQEEFFVVETFSCADSMVEFHQLKGKRLGHEMAHYLANVPPPKPSVVGGGVSQQYTQFLQRVQMMPDEKIQFHKDEKYVLWSSDT